MARIAPFPHDTISAAQVTALAEFLALGLAMRHSVEAYANRVIDEINQAPTASIRTLKDTPKLIEAALGIQRIHDGIISTFGTTTPGFVFPNLDEVGLRRLKRFHWLCAQAASVIGSYSGPGHLVLGDDVVVESACKYAMEAIEIATYECNAIVNWWKMTLPEGQVSREIRVEYDGIDRENPLSTPPCVLYTLYGVARRDRFINGVELRTRWDALPIHIDAMVRMELAQVIKSVDAAPTGGQADTLEELKTSYIETPQDRAILEALNGKALRTDALITQSHIDRTTLFRRIKILKKIGKIMHRKELGYFRPDALPPQLRDQVGTK